MIYAAFLALVALGIFSTMNVIAQVENPEIKCGPHEAVHTCGRRCEDRCNGLRPKDCADLECINRGCRCIDGFFRNPYNNQCVGQGVCFDDGCARGEILATCGRRCEGSCERPTEPESCRGLNCTERECRCDLQGGFVRLKHSRCVRIASCPWD